MSNLIPRLSMQDLTAWAMRALSLPGAPRRLIRSRKVAVSTTAADVQIPTNSDGRRPTYLRVGVPSGASIYANYSAPAVVPTDSVDGGEQLFTGDVIGVQEQWSHISVIAEAAGTLTMTWIWT